MLPTTYPPVEIFATDAGEPALGWGILGPGWIASEFVGAMRKHTIQRPVAVGSRSSERARAFAERFAIENAYGSYEQLVADPAVDVVYVSAPQHEHLRLGLLAIEAGKHVLIEKPLALTSSDAETLVRAARRANVFMMEGMWARYLPQASIIRRFLADGVLGELRSVVADHGQAVPFDPEHRLYSRELGGGSLFDLGVYTVQLDSMVFGAPRSITARGGMTPTGVDAYSTLLLDHGPGRQSVLSNTILAKTPTTGSIIGSEGRLDIGAVFYAPSSLSIADTSFGSPTVDWHDEYARPALEALSWEATALAGFVAEGRTESPLHSLDETVSILRTLEAARDQIEENSIAPGADS